MTALDFELLREQKTWLLEQPGDMAEGLVNLLDALQDAVVASGMATEYEVFGDIE